MDRPNYSLQGSIGGHAELVIAITSSQHGDQHTYEPSSLEFMKCVHVM